MHIPDAYLSPATQAAGFAVMTPLWVIAARKTVRELTSKQAPLLSIGAAFCFAIQMFNIPAIGGTTAHALGAALLAILLGPWAAILGMTLTLTVQALLFGDGGILSLGINCWDMAFVAGVVGYGVFRLISGQSATGSVRQVVGAGIGAYCGTVVASLSAGLILGFQPMIAHDALGHALYCPFGWSVTVPAMVMSHLLIAAPAEAIITVAALSYLWRSFPEFVSERSRPKVGSGLRLTRRLGWVLALTPLGLIAGGSAFGEWDLSTVKQMVGYAPAGSAQVHELIRPLLPDYGFAGLGGKPWEIAGYLVSAVVGCGLVALFTRGVLRRPKVAAEEVSACGRSNNVMPEWLGQPNLALPVAQPDKGRWLERTILSMRSSLAKTIGAEEVARSPGLLQRLHPVVKTLLFLSMLVLTSLAHSDLLLGALLTLALFAAYFSKVPMREFVLRVGGSVAFFGIVLALPLCLQSVTSGPAAFRVFGLTVSSTGMNAAFLIVFRLSTGISLALLWNLTTRWQALLRSLRALRVPEVFLTTATLTYRYLFVIMETLAEMVEARTARQVGACDKKQARAYAGAGTAILFAKSLAFTEEMHLAMQSRSLEGAGKNKIHSTSPEGVFNAL